METEKSTVLQRNTPRKYPKGTPPYPEQSEAQHPAVNEVTVHPSDLELNMTSEPSEGEISPAIPPQRLTTTQLPGPQSPVRNEAVPPPGQDQAQDSHCES